MKTKFIVRGKVRTTIKENSFKNHMYFSLSKCILQLEELFEFKRIYYSLSNEGTYVQIILIKVRISFHFLSMLG